jgi:ribosome recycling factor
MALSTLVGQVTSSRLKRIKVESINLTAVLYQIACISSADQNTYIATGEIESGIKLCDQY